MNTRSVQTERKISGFERVLRVKFPRSYREFLLAHGSMEIAGYTILGIPEEVKNPEIAEIKNGRLDMNKIVDSASCPVCGQKKSVGKATCFPCYNRYSSETGRQSPVSVWIKEKLASQIKARKKDPKKMSVVGAFQFLIEKRPDLADKKLIPVCFKANPNTEKLMDRGANFVFRN